ncbi:hypothetical protein PUN4_60089 [Paraburkholderia unamae]|nr:hypothetical protein PUN4_60089 [Paraburkholderia unamae]
MRGARSASCGAGRGMPSRPEVRGVIIHTKYRRRRSVPFNRTIRQTGIPHLGLGAIVFLSHAFGCPEIHSHRRRASV